MAVINKNDIIQSAKIFNIDIEVAQAKGLYTKASNLRLEKETYLDSHRLSDLEPKAGEVIKFADISDFNVTTSDLAMINKYAIGSVELSKLHTFKAVICDNEIDRDYELFTASTLRKLCPMFIGKTVIKDHNRKSDNQIARIYDTRIVESPERTLIGEKYTQLIAYFYMIETKQTEDFIADVYAGIKKELSISAGIKKATCSICGTNNRITSCNHTWGKSYNGRTCYFTLEDPKDAYEVSFVAVPAQIRASTMKNYNGEYKTGK